MPLLRLDQKKLALANAALETVRAIVRYSDNLSILQVNEDHHQQLLTAYNYNHYRFQSYPEFLMRCIQEGSARCNHLVDIIKIIIEQYPMLFLDINSREPIYYTKISILDKDNPKILKHSFALFHEEIEDPDDYCGEFHVTELLLPIAELLSSCNKDDVIFDPWLWCTCPVSRYIQFFDRAQAFGVQHLFYGVPTVTTNQITLGVPPTGERQQFPMFNFLANSFRIYYREYLRKISEGIPINPIMKSTPEEIQRYIKQLYELEMIMLLEQDCRRTIELEYYDIWKKNHNRCNREKIKLELCSMQAVSHDKPT